MQEKKLSGLNKERENTIESGRSLAESDRYGGSDGRRSPLTRGRWLASAGPAGSPAHVEARGANESLRMARPWNLNCPVPPTTASEPRLKTGADVALAICRHDDRSLGRCGLPLTQTLHTYRHKARALATESTRINPIWNLSVLVSWAR